MKIEELRLIAKRINVNYNNGNNTELINEKLLDWKPILEKLDYDKVNENLSEHIATSQFMPKLSDLTKNIDTSNKKRLIPDSEETMKYLKSLKELDKQGVGKEVANKYLNSLREVLKEYE